MRQLSQVPPVDLSTFPPTIAQHIVYINREIARQAKKKLRRCSYDIENESDDNRTLLRELYVQSGYGYSERLKYPGYKDIYTITIRW